MALWILNRPADCASLAELRVAELLAQLPDAWVIRWGFHYHDDRGINREGDFLVLGPDGGLMVIEVKGGSLDFFPTTGKWCHQDSEDADHPLHQLDAEWKAVVEIVNEHRGQRPSLFVLKALALPQLNLAPDLGSYHDIPRHLILCESDLRQFETTWEKLTKVPGTRLDAAARPIFFDTYGNSVTPRAMRYFVDEADRALLRQTEGNYELLDQLSENQQFLVRGGTGSGKTWLAFEQARRWAEQGPAGSKVLFLCYNLALTDFIREMASKARSRGKPCQGSIEVKSWEELAQSLLTSAGLPYEVPPHDAGKIEFYTHTLPGLMVEIAHSGFCRPEYDALIVDEAQDHDTGISAFPPDWSGPGWWGIYWKLLRQGSKSRIAAFYDPAQRPVFRSETAFDLSALAAAMQNPVRVQLQKSVRYSRPILKFLKTLRTERLSPLVDALRQRGSLPDGPEVVIQDASRSEVPKTAAAIIEKWLSAGLCRADEILLLSMHGHNQKSALGECSMLGGCLVRDFLQRQRGCISRTSVNRAKGLDARAVVLVDFPRFGDISTETQQVSYFMGASRARHLLAIVHTAQ